MQIERRDKSGLQEARPAHPARQSAGQQRSAVRRQLYILLILYLVELANQEGRVLRTVPRVRIPHKIT